jgi:hypothetical protein
MNFTFKTIKPTGRYKSFDSDIIEIKRNKKLVGNISPDKPFKIRLHVIKDGINFKDNNPNCDWKWITLKKESNSIEEAKQFLKDNFEEINKNFSLKEIE